MTHLSTVAALSVLVLAFWLAPQLWKAHNSSIFCEMTYMFPEYRPVDAPDLAAHSYRLMSYHEGWPVRQDTMQDATPALFIPGNAASYAQVRSIASETWRRHARSREGAELGHKVLQPLQWYAVDTREQLTAFDCSFLELQVAFTVAAIKHLARRFNSSQAGGRPIILLGHSMGGIVARAAVARLAAEHTHAAPRLPIHLVLTLSSPHQRPPLLLQICQASAHALLQRAAWPETPLVSIAAGAADTQVAEQLTRLQGVVPPHLGFHASMRDMAGVWTCADHQMVVWCNQLVQKLAGMLLEAAEQHDAPSPAEQARRVLATVRKHLSTHAAAALAAVPADHPPPHQPQPQHQHQQQQEQRQRDPAGGEGADAGPPAACPARVAGCGRCLGTNLAWHEQYLRPKTVKARLLQLNATNAKAAKLGRLWRWDLSSVDTAQPQSLLLLVVGLRPCEEWKLWMEWSHSGCGGRNVSDITQLAAPAPPLFREARPLVRQQSMSDEVMQGRDYSSGSSWMLRLTERELHGAVGLKLWVSTKKLPPGFHVTVQLAQSALPLLRVGGPLSSWVAGGSRVQPGALAVQQLEPGAPPALLHMLDLGLAISSVPSTTSRCWLPLAVLPSSAAGNQTHPPDHTAPDQLLPVPTMPVAVPWQDISRVLLLLDPSCSHTLTLRPATLHQAVPSIVTHAASILGLMLALSTANLRFVLPSTALQVPWGRALLSKPAFVLLASTTLLCAVLCFLCPKPASPNVSSEAEGGSRALAVIKLSLFWPVVFLCRPWHRGLVMLFDCVNWHLLPTLPTQLLLLVVAATAVKLAGWALVVLVLLLALPLAAVQYLLLRGRADDTGTAKLEEAGDTGAAKLETADESGTETSEAADGTGTEKSEAAGDTGTAKPEAADDTGAADPEAGGETGTAQLVAAGGTTAPFAFAQAQVFQILLLLLLAMPEGGNLAAAVGLVFVLPALLLAAAWARASRMLARAGPAQDGSRQAAVMHAWLLWLTCAAAFWIPTLAAAIHAYLHKEAPENVDTALHSKSTPQKSTPRQGPDLPYVWGSALSVFLPQLWDFWLSDGFHVSTAGVLLRAGAVGTAVLSMFGLGVVAMYVASIVAFVVLTVTQKS